MKDSDLGELLESYVNSGLEFVTHLNKTDVVPRVSVDSPSPDLFSNLRVETSSTIPDYSLPLIPKGPRKFSDKFRLHLEAKLFSNQKDLERQCRALAVSPDDILTRKHVYPIPEPKNVRYIENYRRVRTLPNGSFVAVQTNTKTSLHEMEERFSVIASVKSSSSSNNNNNKMDEKLSLNSSSSNNNKCSSNINDKLNSSSNINDNNNRKQKRKRGLKKKKPLT